MQTIRIVEKISKMLEDKGRPLSNQQALELFQRTDVHFNPDKLRCIRIPLKDFGESWRIV
jgi:hypothetical protein